MSHGKIILSNNSQYIYSVQDREVTNPLGIVVAVLKEYVISSPKEENLNDVICRICKTKEGSWCDLEETEQPGIRLLLPHLKSAIDKAEEKELSSVFSGIKMGYKSPSSAKE